MTGMPWAPLRAALIIVLAGALASGVAGCGRGASGASTTGAGSSGRATVRMPTDGDALVLSYRAGRAADPALFDHRAVTPDLVVTASGRVLRTQKGTTTSRTVDADTVATLLRLAATVRPGTGDLRAPTAELAVWDGAGSTGLSLLPEEGEALLQRLDAALPDATTAYRPERVAVLAIAGGGGEQRAWPLGDLAGGDTLGAARCHVLEGEQTARALGLGTGPGVAWTSRGVEYAVVVRPMLPGETSCATLR